MGGTLSPSTFQTKGTYIGWNAFGGSTGEADFINYHGGGTGGFAFFDSSNFGSSPLSTPPQPLVFISPVGNIGIKTANPATPLHIFADGEAIRMGTGIGTTGSFLGFEYSSVGGDRIQVGYLPNAYGTDTGIGYLKAGSTKGVGLITNAGVDPSLYVNAAGKVGIGTTLPAYPLDVTGQIRSTGGVVFPDGTIQSTAYTEVAAGSNAITQSNGYVGIGTTTPTDALMVNAGATNFNPSLTYGAPAAFSFQTAGVELAEGVASSTPYAYWLQARQVTNAAWALSLNPLGVKFQ